MRKGFFLVLDGIDGCGKSTQSRLLYDYFKENGFKIVITAEPTEGEIGKILRKCLTDNNVPAALDALLFAADRLDHCREIESLLNRGYLVISDRYRDSSYIYQYTQAKLKNEDISMEWLKEINKMSLNPDLTIILDINPEISLSRRVKENESSENDLEKFEKIEFQKKIQKQFLKIAHEHMHDDIDKHILIQADKPSRDLFNEILNLLICDNIEKRIERYG